MIKTYPCPYCGQIVHIEAKENMTEAQLKAQAIDSCNCNEAVNESEKRKRLKNVNEYIENLFDSYPDRIELFKTSVRQIYEGNVKKIQINDFEWSYSISTDSKSMINICRTKSIKEDTSF